MTQRTRTCDDPAPQYDGKMCIGITEEEKPCFETDCESMAWFGHTKGCLNLFFQFMGDGGRGLLGKTVWMTVSTLQHSNERGQCYKFNSLNRVVKRNVVFRVCDNPLPEHNGLTCPGLEEEYECPILDDCPSKLHLNSIK